MKANFNLGDVIRITLETNQFIDLYNVRTSGGFSIAFSDDNCPESILAYVSNIPCTKYEKRERYNYYVWEVGEEI